MPDGSPPSLSLVERALQLPGWRALRRRLPGPLRRQLPINPPENMEARRPLALRVLRERRRQIAESLEPTWRVKISDAAAAYGVDRGTVADWLTKSKLRTERGRIIITGSEALTIARRVWCASPPSSAAEAIERLQADLERRKREPRERPAVAARGSPGLGYFWIDLLALPEGTDKVADPAYADLGTGGVTVDQLVSLLSTPLTKSPAKLASLGVVVRRVLDRHEVAPPLAPEWLATAAGQSFWYELLASTPMGRRLWRQLVANERKFSSNRADR